METRFTKASAFFRNISRKVSLFKDRWTEKTTALLRINPESSFPSCAYHQLFTALSFKTKI